MPVQLPNPVVGRFTAARGSAPDPNPGELGSYWNPVGREVVRTGGFARGWNPPRWGPAAERPTGRAESVLLIQGEGETVALGRIEEMESPRWMAFSRVPACAGTESARRWSVGCGYMLCSTR